MKKALVALFLTAPRRRFTTFGALISIAVSSLGTVHYLDEVCASPAIALLVLILWIFLVIALWWVILMAMSPSVILPSFLEEWMTQNALELSIFSTKPQQSKTEQLTELGFELMRLDPYDPRQFQVNAESRFRLLFITGVMGCLLLTHFTQDHFLTRFQKVGLTLTYLRSDISLTRLKGLNILVDLGRYRLVSTSDEGEEFVASALEKAILHMLADPHEGVRARAAFVSGNLHLKSAVPILEEMSKEDDILREVALLALGAMPVIPITPHPAHLALKRLSKYQKVTDQQPLALSFALGRQRVHVGDLLVKIYKTHLTENKQTPHHESRAIRETAIWALGELRDAVYIQALDEALRDPELTVRCLAALSFEKMVVFESSTLLRRAFESSVKEAQCPQVIAPTQEGVKALVLIEKKSYQLVLMRALATTDDPRLMQWMVDHQEGIDPMANRLMYKYYKTLEKKEKSGLLDSLKRRISK